MKALRCCINCKPPTGVFKKTIPITEEEAMAMGLRLEEIRSRSFYRKVEGWRKTI